MRTLNEEKSLLPSRSTIRKSSKESFISRLSEQVLIGMENFIEKRYKKGSMTSSFFALVNTTMGVGILGLPWAYSKNGLLQGIFMTIISGMFSTLACILLSEISLNEDPTGTMMPVTYYSIAEKTFPKLKSLIDTSILVMSLGSCITYLMVVVAVIQTLFGGFLAPYLSESNTRTAILLFVVIFIIGPASYPTSLAELTIINWIAVFSSLYVAAVVIFSFLVGLPELKTMLEKVELISTGRPIFMLQTFPIFVFSFTCHHNFLNVANELADKTLYKLIFSSAVSLGFCTLIYILMGSSGYMLFGNTLKSSDILSMFGAQSLTVVIAKIVLVSSLVFSFPVSCHSFRKSLAVIIKSGEDAEGSSTKDRHLLRTLTFIFLFICTTVTYFVSDLGLTYEFVGLFCSNTVCYFLPAVLHLKLFSDSPWNTSKIMAVILLIFSILVYPLCFSAIIYTHFFSNH
ncbi:Transmembrane amino acid transporter protein family protein [Cryptosporidium meleagridis]|uniref:Transmembrane amino acid transporter protein family protein n=1 Tax=Cryptosporidium meleagridis TaxID=93969 RepID=A0A2P4Z3Z0_9CRYT|nr:Transmembrane amino acid transporter protein family protein [Cryptosporidium meleagridis]